MRIKQLRSYKNITQEALAEMLDIKLSHLLCYESEKWSPDQNALIRLADLFGVTVDYLLCREGVPSSISYDEFDKLLSKNKAKVAFARLSTAQLTLLCDIIRSF